MNLSVAANRYRGGGGGGTDPLWADVGFLLHCNGAPGSIVFPDEKGNTTTPNGGAQVSGSFSAFGGGSAQLLSNTDYIDVPSPAIGIDDFCLEFQYRYAGLHFTIPMDYRPSLTNGLYPCLYVDNGIINFFVNGVSLIVASTAMTDSTFQSIRLDRDTGVTTLYLDGASVGSVVDANIYLGTRARFGSSGYDPATVTGCGYLDEIRGTFGASRGTTDLPQTAEWPNS